MIFKLVCPRHFAKMHENCDISRKCSPKTCNLVMNIGSFGVINNPGYTVLLQCYSIVIVDLYRRMRIAERGFDLSPDIWNF
jgi:hypothetical protein